MTTEPSVCKPTVAAGEPMVDLVHRLDHLLAEARREAVPLSEFYQKLPVIECEVLRGLGKPPPATARRVSSPPNPPGSGGLDSAEEDAYDIWDAGGRAELFRRHPLLRRVIRLALRELETRGIGGLD